MNKLSFCFIFIMIIISFDHETCLAVFFATIVYYFFYVRASKLDYFYKIEKLSTEQI